MRSRLVAAKYAAVEIGIPYSTLRKQVIEGNLPVVKVGTAWYFDRRDLERYIQDNKATGDQVVA